MAANKKQAVDTADVSLADSAKAPGHPTRIAIPKTLAERSVCVCREWVDELPPAQATVSQPLTDRKKAGLIKGEIDGARFCSGINRAVPEEIIGAFDHHFAGLQRPSEPPECC